VEQLDLYDRLLAVSTLARATVGGALARWGLR
jgi:hypothetical protein